MVNWFKQFENYPGSRVEARIVHGGNDKTVSYRHNLPLWIGGINAAVFSQFQKPATI